MKMFSLLMYTFYLALFFIFTGCSAHKCSEQGDQPVKGQLLIENYPSAGDQARIEGVVKDFKSGELLTFAKITFQNAEGKIFGCLSDENGYFVLPKIPFDDYELKISNLGYDELSTHFRVKSAQSYRLTARLTYEPIEVLKPVIYFYPPQKTNLTVRLNYQGQIVHSYPKYPENGWNILADTNGTLWDEKGQEYYALFWEGLPDENIQPTCGFIVPGNETAEFLEEKLDYLGLNRREANEFIMYWLPKMENNPYNLIHFSGAAYERQAPLEITPHPETLIRVMMLTQGLQTKINFPLQDLSPLKKERKGFTVVEWGGCSVNAIGL